MSNIAWLASEAKNLHDFFQSIYYALILTFLLLGVLIEYFKWPLGGIPSFSILVGRVLVASILLHTFPDVLNTVADVTDAVANRIGDFNQLKVVAEKMKGKYDELSWSWMSVKESVTMLISFVSFFLLYFSIHVCQAFTLYTWSLLYVFSPLLISLFVLPQTSGATKGLYRSIFEVSCWKIVWSVLATLLWSAALSDIHKPEYEISFVTAVSLNLILAGSLLLTPLVVHALMGSGIASLARTVGSIAVGATVISPLKVAQSGKAFAKKFYGPSDPKGGIKHQRRSNFKQPTQNQSSNSRSSNANHNRVGQGQRPKSDPKGSPR